MSQQLPDSLLQGFLFELERYAGSPAVRYEAPDTGSVSWCWSWEGHDMLEIRLDDDETPLSYCWSTFDDAEPMIENPHEWLPLGLIHPELARALRRLRHGTCKPYE